LLAPGPAICQLSIVIGLVAAFARTRWLAVSDRTLASAAIVSCYFNLEEVDWVI
jgi:hypothetical protein